MKKLFAALIALIAVLCLSASAEELSVRCPTGGLITYPAPTEAQAKDTEGSESFEHFGDYVTGNDVTFTFPADCGKIQMAKTVSWSKYYQVVYSTSDAETFTYHFYEPGYYGIWIGGKCAGCFDVTGTDLLAARVEEIAAQCPEGSDYETALWLHDWLATNTYYDSTLTYHGPDYLLFEGYGVCQSYYQAYRLLLKEFGIECECVSSSNHGWNEVKIGGEWYEVDTTWDTRGYAPYGEGEPADYCCHIYFLVPDSLISLDHSGYELAYECTSIASNYFVRSGIGKEWLDELWDDFSAEFWGETMETSVAADNGRELAYDDYYFRLRDRYTAEVIAYLLNDTDVRNGYDYTYHVYAEADTEGNFTVTGSAVLNTFTLPADTEEIGSGAFSGSLIEKAVLPEGITSIGAEAFADSRLYVINLPPSLTYIADDAFDDCPADTVIVTAEPGTYAYERAEALGLDIVTEDIVSEEE